MIDFSTLQGLAIPEGSVSKITDSAGAVLWQKAEDNKYTWDAVLASIAAGTYATDYAVGDCVPLDLGSEGTVNMQIAGFDVDDKADGSGKAAISWISKELLNIQREMNPILDTNDDGTYKDGTGTIGGWGGSELRSYLISTIYPLIPEPVKSAIVTVTKTQPAYNTSGESFTQTTTDNVWIPSYSEVYGSSSAYISLFENSISKRVKCVLGVGFIGEWFLRSAETLSIAYAVYSSGDLMSASVYSVKYIVLCFCT